MITVKLSVTTLSQPSTEDKESVYIQKDCNYYHSIDNFWQLVTETLVKVELPNVKSNSSILSQPKIDCKVSR